MEETSETNFTPPDDDLRRRMEALESTVARLSVQQALMDERLLALEQNRLFRWWNDIYRAAARLYGRLGIGQRYGGLSDLRTPGDYERWLSREASAPLAPLRSQPLISVIVTEGPGSAESVRSVRAQSYANWQLSAAGEDPAGDYQLTLHAGDRLSPHALHFYAQALQDDSPDIVYADEDLIDSSGNHSEPLFKPGWSPELLRSTMYLGRAMLRRGAARPTPSSCVRHVSRVLYHRAASTPPDYARAHDPAPSDARFSLIVCSRNVRQVAECLAAVRYTSAIPMEILVVHHLESGGGDDMRQVSAQFGATWIPYRGPFDFARMNNLAAGQATAPLLLIMNDDVIVEERGWDQALAAALARPGIGIAGAILEYPNGTIQHAGVVTGMGDAAGHCGRFQMTSKLWPWLRMSRDVSAVTGAMLAIRSDRFQQLRGFDPAFAVNYNDVDLCLRVRDAGLSVVCLDLGKIVHRESQTRIGGTRYAERDALYQRWPRVLARADEFYSVNLAPTERISLSGSGSPLQELAIKPPAA
jgi:hypothetical protein